MKQTVSNIRNKYQGDYIVIYNDEKIIDNIFIAPTCTSTMYNGFVTDTYENLVNFIYDNKLHQDKRRRYNWSYNLTIMPDFMETIYKTDD